jgi:hypothetical protein
MVVIVHVKKRIAPHAVLRVTCFGIIARVCVPVRGRACARVCVCVRVHMGCVCFGDSQETNRFNEPALAQVCRYLTFVQIPRV